MKKSKVVVGILSIAVVLALVTGCSSSEKQAASQSPASQQKSGHEGMDMSGHENMSMPKEDPMPMMKDMDQQLQSLMKQVKAGQTMEAQKTAGQLASITEKIVPHMMDNGLKDNLRKAAGDIKNTVNSGKIDPSALEAKVKTMQEVMKQTTADLQTMKHQ
jgi:preprotein translocase subunit SecF